MVSFCKSIFPHYQIHFIQRYNMSVVIKYLQNGVSESMICYSLEEVESISVTRLPPPPALPTALRRLLRDQAEQCWVVITVKGNKKTNYHGMVIESRNKSALEEQIVNIMTNKNSSTPYRLDSYYIPISSFC